MAEGNTVLTEFVRAAKGLGASDIHLALGRTPQVRVDGQLRDLNAAIAAEAFTAEALEAVARDVAGASFEELARTGELDLAQTIDGTRCRINLFRSQGAYHVALRLLAEAIPELESLGLPPAVLDFPGLNRGIVLVTGETGSGKSTTLASLLERINQQRNVHIVTLEDPIEYLYTPKCANISQRQVGADTASFASGLRSVLRQDPDIILIGEMRDLETIEAALTAAETGHLVFSTLHTASAAESIDRLVDVFPAQRQAQIRMQLSTTLAAVLSQQLLAARSGQGRVLAAELMMVNPAIRNLIREGKTPQIENAIATSAESGSITMDNALLRLVRASAIGSQTAIAAAHDADYVSRGLRA